MSSELSPGLVLGDDFPAQARVALEDAQLRTNLRNATHTIRDKRDEATAELPDWQQLREAGRLIKHHTMRHLDEHLLALEASVTRAGGQVHWAADAAAANRIVGDLVAATGAREVVKVKSIATDEIGLNAALEARGFGVQETDLAELINQLSGDHASHILVPAIHRNRAEIRDLFRAGLPDAGGVSDEPAALAEAARRFLREQFLSARVAVSGANFAIAETGTICVVESEGNGRMCTTLPETLITVMGIEKVLPRLADLEVMLQLLPRSSTAERMNPYTSLWTGVRDGDGPREFHLVLLDAGRTTALADEVGRQALHCIRCSACLNVCPVYERTGGHAYGSVYPGPIGAILTPQLADLKAGTTLPWASSLCGACYEVCPVKIDIPTVLVHLRGKITRREAEGHRMEHIGERASMSLSARIFAVPRRYRLAQRLGGPVGRFLGRHPWLSRALPGPVAGWTATRELPVPPVETFADWWRGRATGGARGGAVRDARGGAARDGADR
jgi:L-lactate dehydrogenase complex protein LldF